MINGRISRAIGCPESPAAMAAKTGLFATALKWLERKLAKDAGSAAARPALRDTVSNLRNGARRAGSRTTAGDPIDVATGEVVIHEMDVELPAALPLVLERTHVSSYRDGRLFGMSWTSTLDQRLDWDGTAMTFTAADGMTLVYPPPTSAGPVLPQAGPRWPLVLADDGGCTVTDPELGRSLRFAPATGRTFPLTAVSDRNGHRFDLSYDDEGTLTEVRHSGGHRIAVETDAGRIVALRLASADPGPVLARYGYDEAGHLAEVVNSSGLPHRFEYDAEGRVARSTDRNGFWYEYTYDETGRAVRGLGADGCLDVRLSYADGATTVTDSLGHDTVYRFNDLGQLVAVVDPLGGTTRAEWDRHDRLLSRTDQLDEVTRYAYDADGGLAAVTFPDGSRTTTVRDALGLPIEITDPVGATWRRTYDESGNLLELIDPAGAVERYTYDESGHLVAFTDAAGNTARLTWDAAGRPLTATDASGFTTRYTRDPFGRVATITDSDGGVIKLGWTPEGKLATRTRPGGGTDRWTYDAEGNLLTQTDAVGQVTRYELTRSGQRSAQIGADGARYEFSFDTALRLTTVTNPQGQVWRYTYDPAGNLARERDFNGHEITYAHDPAGRLAARASGEQVVRFTRDALGRVVERRAGDVLTVFGYDPAGNLIQATNGDADLRFERDILGRVTTETCDGRALTTRYDAAGRYAGRRTPSGVESTWEYDADQRPVALRTDGGVIRFGYDEMGREVQRRVGDGAVLDQRWSADHQLVSQSLRGGPERLLANRTYAYRPDGYVVGMDDRRVDLDAVGRVTAVHARDWNERYTYDTSGNLTHAAWPTSPPGAENEASGDREYAGPLIRRAGNVHYEHDEQGRVTLRRQRRLSAGPLRWHYTWDADDRLTEVVTPAGSRWRYRYDALGRRVAKQRLAADGLGVVEQVEFVWHGCVVVEQAHTVRPGETRTTTWDYKPGTFHPVAQTERRSARDAPQEWIDERFHAIVADLSGAAIELVTPDGEIGWRSRRTVWGSTLAEYSRGSTCPLRAPGQYHDAETGLYYNYRRYYDPETARYQSPDPLGLTPQPNPYSYVHNPIMCMDPLGLAPMFTEPAKAGHTRVYRFGNRNNPTELLSGLEKNGLPEEQVFHRRGLEDPAVAATRAEFHARGDTDLSPFISVAADPNAAAATTDAWLKSITRKAPDLAAFDVPNNELTAPSSELSVRETELLYKGGDLAKRLVGWTPNPFKGRP